MSGWTVYILKCCDDSYYTGITNNLAKRFQDHQNGTGAKYTRGRGPFTVIYQETHRDRSAASKREYFIKNLTRKQKIMLIHNRPSLGP